MHRGEIRQRARSRATASVAAIVILWFAAVVVGAAWQCDDAYITFRSADNLWRGLGLVWNPGERVQPFTSPLWMVVAVIIRGSGDVYFGTLLASILLAVTAAGLLVLRLRQDRLPAALVLAALSTSAAVIDYATSGLENSLLYLLLLLLLLELRRADPGRRVRRLALLTALIALTRLDAVLFVLPALGWAVWHHGRRGVLRKLLLGLSPLIAWELFALVYYGSLVPNTAQAKLNLEIPLLTLATQGLRYFADCARHDPVTLILIFAGLAGSAWKGRDGERLLAAGVACYLVYVIRIGGDFMAGRFLAAPAVASAGLLVSMLPAFERAHAPGRPRVTAAAAAAAVAVAAVVCYGLLWPQSRWLAGAEFGMEQAKAPIVRQSGIADERAYYAPSTGLLRVLLFRQSIASRGLPLPPYPGAVLGRKFSRGARRVTVMSEIGFFGYFAGPTKTVVDQWALADPLLARLPFRPAGTWRIGHYPRRIPKGYLATLESGSDRFVDRGIAELHRAISTVTRGPLFAAERWREIWRLHTGHYDPVGNRPDYN